MQGYTNSMMLTDIGKRVPYINSVRKKGELMCIRTSDRIFMYSYS